MPPLVCGPAFYLLRAITALENAITFRINVTSLGKDCCPIVNSFEKNYRTGLVIVTGRTTVIVDGRKAVFVDRRSAVSVI